MKALSLFSDVDEARAREFFPTPVWFATHLFEQEFGGLTERDIVLDCSAGEGHFLAACPATVSAYGVEIDPDRARICTERTGRPTVVGDFLTVSLDIQPTAIVSSPPFSLARPFLERAHRLLPNGGQVGFILPASVLSYSRAVRELADRWSIRTNLIPRDIYPRATQIPLIFAVFSKDEKKMLMGLAGFHEAAAVRDMPRRFASLLYDRPAPRVWRDVVEEALRALGGEATLTQINMVVAGAGYARGPWWRDKIRQVCGQHFERRDRGRYALAVPA